VAGDCDIASSADFAILYAPYLAWEWRTTIEFTDAAQTHLFACRLRADRRPGHRALQGSVTVWPHAVVLASVSIRFNASRANESTS
jgi:hypothetical protein